MAGNYRAQSGDHRLLWIGEAELKGIRKLIVREAKSQGRILDVKGLLERIDAVLHAFKDAAERLRELEVVCRANQFWVDDATASTGMVKRIRVTRKTRHQAEDEVIAHGTPEEVRVVLEQNGRVKPKAKKAKTKGRLRGGLER